MAKSAAAGELLSKKYKINVSIPDGSKGAMQYLASEVDMHSDLVTAVPQEFADKIGQ